MINTIIYTELDLSLIGEISFQKVAIPEMLDGCYNIIAEQDQWDLLDDYLTANDNKYEVVGEWLREDGKAKEDGKVKNKYKKAKYAKYLRDIPTEWDAEGIPTKWGKPPEDKKVNKIYGWIDRDLTIEP